MLYVFPTTDGETTYNVVIMATLQAETVADISFEQILGVPSALSLAQTHGDRINVVALENVPAGTQRILPVYTGTVTPPQTLPVGPILGFFQKNPDSLNEGVFAGLAEKYKQQLRGAGAVVPDTFGASTISSLYAAYKKYLQYVAGQLQFKIVVPDTSYLNVRHTREVINSWNAKMGPAIVGGLNQTNKMEDPSDRFFIKLPEYDLLRNEDLSIRAMIPPAEDIVDPYGHFIYQTPYFEEVRKLSHEQLRADIINIGGLLGVDARDTKYLTIPFVPLEEVVGNPDNNDLDIQPNEQDFADSLTALIKYDIKQFRPDMDEDQAFKDCIVSPRMMRYLQELIRLAVSVNWGHTGNFPLGYLDVSDDEEDLSDNSSTDYQDTVEYFNGYEGRNGEAKLTRFIERNATVAGMGMTAYVQAIIKLFRWGYQKPSMLKIAQTEGYLNMGTMMLSSNSGSFNDMQVIKVAGKYELQPVKLIILDDQFKDLAYRKKIGATNARVEIPIGVLAVKRYENGATRQYAMTFIDIIQHLREDPTPWMYGFDVVDGKILVNLPESVTDSTIELRKVRVATKDLVLMDTSAMREIVLTYNVKDMSSTQVLAEHLYSESNLTQYAEQLKFSGPQDLNQKLPNAYVAKEMFISVGLATLLVPIILKANDYYIERNHASLGSPEYGIAIIGDHMQAMADTGFKRETQLWLANGEEQAASAPATPPPATSSNLSRLATMNQFGDSAATAQTEKPTAPTTQSPQPTAVETTATNQVPAAEPTVSAPLSLGSVSIVPFAPTDKLRSVMRGKDIVACFARREEIDNGQKKTIIIFGSPDKMPVPEPSPNDMDSINPMLWDYVLNALQGTPEKSPVRFNSIQDVALVQGIFAKIWEARVAEIRAARAAKG